MQKTLQICTHYSINGSQSTSFPLAPELDLARPIYEEMPGWEVDIKSVRRYDDLPEGARRYVDRIEQLIGVHVRYISVGPERDALITR